MKNIKFIMLLIALSILLTACAGGQAQVSNEEKTEELHKIKISTINSIIWAPVFIAESEGFFEKNGLDVEFTTPGGPKGFQAMHAGDVEFSMLSQEPLLIAQEQGMKSKIISSMIETRLYGLVSKKDITEIQQLKGKKVYASNPASAPYVFVDNVLKKDGLDPLKDLQYVNAADTNAGLQAFIAGEVDAAYINIPDLNVIKDLEYNILADTTTAEGSDKYLGSSDFPATILCTSDKYIEENPEIVQKVVTSIAEAQKWISENSSEEIAKSLKPVIGQIDKEILKGQVDIVRDKFSLDSMITEEGQQTIIDMLVDAGVIGTQIPYDEVIDMTFVIEANKQLGL